MRIIPMIVLIVFLTVVPFFGAYLLVEPQEHKSINEELVEDNESTEAEKETEEKDEKEKNEKDEPDCEFATLVEEMRQNIPEERRYPAVENREHRDIFFDDDNNPLTEPIPSPRHE